MCRTPLPAPLRLVLAPIRMGRQARLACRQGSAVRPLGARSIVLFDPSTPLTNKMLKINWLKNCSMEVCVNFEPLRFNGRAACRSPEPEAPAQLKPLIPVILAGGVGSRLWPLSRAMFPKPFHALFGERSLLQNTVLRAREATGRRPIVVCNEANRFLVAEQLRALDFAWRHIVLEPEGKSTAPAIALGAHMALREVQDAQLLVLPADHLIDDDAGFAEAVRTGACSE